MVLPGKPLSSRLKPTISRDFLIGRVIALPFRDTPAF
jgi:hypothetical protein